MLGMSASARCAPCGAARLRCAPRRALRMPCAAASARAALDSRLLLGAEVADAFVSAVVLGSPCLWEGGIAPPPEASTNADTDTSGPWVAVWAASLEREDAWPPGMWQALDW
jgi:hypothetical protein